MRSSRAKGFLHEIAGRSLLGHVLTALSRRQRRRRGRCWADSDASRLKRARAARRAIFVQVKRARPAMRCSPARSACYNRGLPSCDLVDTR